MPSESSQFLASFLVTLSALVLLLFVALPVIIYYVLYSTTVAVRTLNSTCQQSDDNTLISRQ